MNYFPPLGHLSACLLVVSKLKTIDYLFKYTGIIIDISKVYRYLDKLQNDQLKQVQQVSYTHTAAAQSFEHLNDVIKGFEDIKLNGPALIASVTNIIANMGTYKIKVWDIPRALMNLKEGLKPIRYSIESSIDMLAVIADLKTKIKGSNNVSVNTQQIPSQDKAPMVFADTSEKQSTPLLPLKA